MMAMTPPATPPAMAPTGVDLPLVVAVSVRPPTLPMTVALTTVAMLDVDCETTPLVRR